MDVMSVLDSLIAMVVVILLLSLVVQAIQEGLKKLFKIKSRQLEDSLVDLLEIVVGRSWATTPRATRSGAVDYVNPQRFSGAPFVRVLTLQASTKYASAEVKQVLTALKARLRDIGRVAQSGTDAVESLSQEDLEKLLDSLPARDLHPSAQGLLAQLGSAHARLDSALNALGALQLAGNAGTAAAEVRATAAPIMQELTAALDSASGGSVAALERLPFSELRGSIAALRNQANGNGGVHNVANDLESAYSALVAGVAVSAAPMKDVRESVGSWYSTVMTGFEERYNRGMRTWAWVIGLAVVIFTNANFFTIAQRITQDDAVRASIIAAAPEVRKMFDEAGAKAQEAATAAAAQGEGAAELKAAAREELRKTVEELRADVEAKLSVYTRFGFKTMSMSDLEKWWAQLSFNPLDEGWFPARLGDLKHLVGWLIMTMLLSVGAPFWKDALESLFGVKNLLRGKAASTAADTGGGSG